MIPNHFDAMNPFEGLADAVDRHSLSEIENHLFGDQLYKVIVLPILGVFTGVLANRSLKSFFCSFSNFY